MKGTNYYLGRYACILGKSFRVFCHTILATVSTSTFLILAIHSQEIFTFAGSFRTCNINTQKVTKSIFIPDSAGNLTLSWVGCFTRIIMFNKAITSRQWNYCRFFDNILANNLFPMSKFKMCPQPAYQKTKFW